MKYNELRELFEKKIPFNQHLGIHLGDLKEGRAELILPFRDELIGDSGRMALHGGVISALIDTAGGAAAFTSMDSGDRISTVDLRVDFLLPGKPEELRAHAWILRKGNRVIVTAAKAFQGDPETPIAEGRAVYNLRRARRGES